MADVNLTHTGAELDDAIAKVLADYADVSGVTAAAADVMTGKIFVDASGEEVAGTNDGSGDTSDATANAGRILAPYTAYVAAGKVTGAMPNNAGDVAAVSYHADGTSIHVVPAEGYTDGTDDAVVITDADFVAENIKSGVNLFGKDGSMAGGAADSIVITAVNASKRITAVDASSFAEIYPYQFNNYASNDGVYIYMASIVLSAELTKIGQYAFENSANLVLTSLPDSITDIGAYAFYNCPKIALVSLPANLTIIKTYSFAYCNLLAITSLPESITEVETLAFYGSPSFRRLWIGINCVTIAGATSSASPWRNNSEELVFYCEAESKPAGWGTYWNYRYFSSVYFTVNWGVSKAEYDALFE